MYAPTTESSTFAGRMPALPVRRFRRQKANNCLGGAAACAGAAEGPHDFAEASFDLGAPSVVAEQGQGGVGDVFGSGRALDEFWEDFLLCKQIGHSEVTDFDDALADFEGDPPGFVNRNRGHARAGAFGR